MDKPKQGKVFREFRGEIMNFKVDYDNKVEKKIPVPGLQE